MSPSSKQDANYFIAFKIHSNMEQTKYDVFISYSWNDVDIAQEIYDAIVNSGLRCCFDRETYHGGADFPEITATNICNSNVFLFLGSKSSFTSGWAPDEVAFAKSHKPRGKLLYYAIDNNTMPKWIDLAFAAINRRNIFEHPYKSVLINDIKNILGDANGIAIHRIDDASIEKLIKDRIEHVISSQDILHQTELHINVDADCKLFLFNKFKQQLEADKEHIIYLLPGTHKLSFVSTEIPEVRISKVLDLKADKEKEYIKILLKEETTRKAEEEASRSETLSILNKFFGNRKSEEEKKETLYKYGLALSEKKKDYEAFILYKRAASAGHAHSQYLMGIYYSKTKKYPEAFEWFKKAAEQNHPEAQYSIGKFYYNGYTGKTDYSEALKWFRKAADNNNYKAHNMIGIMYEEGKGIPQNFNSAFDHYFFAGKMGNAIAQYNIGRLIELEKVSHYSLSKSDALHWFKEAAKKGNKDAISKLKDLKESY